MRKFRTAAALALCAVCLLQTAAPVLAAEDYPAPDVSGKTVEELIDAFRADHDLTEDNFELSYYNTVTGESYDFNETKMLYGASTYKLPLNLYYYDMQLAGEITGDTMITKGSTLDEAHYQSLVYSNNELSYSLWRRIGDWPEYKQAMRKYFTMTDEEIPQNYYYDHLFCTRMMMDTLKVAPAQESTTRWASSRLCSSVFSPPKPVKRPMTFALPMVKGAEMVQYSSGTNTSISCSRSQIILVATDCTRPALRPFLTLRQSSGLIL